MVATLTLMSVATVRQGTALQLVAEASGHEGVLDPWEQLCSASDGVPLAISHDLMIAVAFLLLSTCILRLDVAV